MSVSGSSNWTSEGGDLEDINGGIVNSLFDDFSSESIEAVWNHLFAVHAIDTIKIKKFLTDNGASFDDYARMRMVNYCRRSFRNGVSIPSIAASLISDLSIYSNDENLVPVDPEDRLLWEATPADGFGEDDFDEEAFNATNANVIAEDSRIPVVTKTVESLESEVERLRALLRQFTGGEDDSSSEASSNKANQPASIIKDDKLADAAIQRREFSSKEDVAYFESYSFDDIHRVMILDQIRTGSYKAFLTQNPQAFKGKTVLDVGCGSGILSMFCAAAGAKRVVGLDAAAVTAAKARRNITLNKFESTVQVVVGKVEDMDLYINNETDKVEPFARNSEVDLTKYTPFTCDILVSEWMGYALLFEGMLYSVIDARDRWLIDGGLVVPSQTTLALHGVDYRIEWANERDWFKPGKTTFGLDMRMLAPEMTSILKSPEVEIVPKDRIRSGMLELCTIDLALVSKEVLRALRVPFEFKTEGKEVSSLALSFDTIFEADRKHIKSLVGKAEGAHAGVRIRSVEERANTAITWRNPTPDFRAELETAGLAHTDANGRVFAGSHGDLFDKMEDNIINEKKEISSSGTTVVFGTSPEDPPTHWKQTVMHLIDNERKDHAVIKATDGHIKGSFAISPSAHNPRFVTITLEIDSASVILDDGSEVEMKSNVNTYIPLM